MEIAYQDNNYRIEVERRFSLEKRKFGLGLLFTKREDTTSKSSIVLSVTAMNLDRLAVLFLLYFKFFLSPLRFVVSLRYFLVMVGY